MSEPVFVDHPRGRSWLKWHRACRQPGDMEFAPARILQGLRAGARVEIDLVRHRGGGFAVLHDMTLDRGTTGTGPVAEADADTLRGLFRRGPDGMVTDTPVAVLADLCADLAASGWTAGAELQLDLKEDAAALTPADVEAFARAVAPVCGAMLLSGGDAAAVRRLAGAVPGLAIGHDPCHFGSLQRLIETGDVTGFVAQALEEAGNAPVIYLDIKGIEAMARQGRDLVAPFLAEGRRVDAYTVNRIDAENVARVRRLLAMGVQQITTDDPAGLHAALSAPVAAKP